jgi:hypothetical protein
MSSQIAGLSRGGAIARSFVIVALLILQNACAGVGPHPPLPISEVVALSKRDTQPELVIAKLRSTKSVYAPRGSDFGKLADLGVKAPVLDAIQVSFVGDVELLTRYYALGESLGGCVYCFPQPLNLASLASGGNGMSPDLPTGNYTGAGRPPGVPQWVPVPPGGAFRGADLSIDDVVKRFKDGVPAETLVRQVRASRLTGLIAQGGLTLGTMSSVGLTGSRLAALHTEGLPDAVLDALQEQYLAQFVEYERLRYQNSGKGPSMS